MRRALVVLLMLSGCGEEPPPDCERICCEERAPGFPYFVAGQVCEDGRSCSCKINPVYGGQWTPCAE